MRPGMAPGPGLEALRAAVGAAGPRFAWTAPFSDPTSSSTAGWVQRASAPEA